MELLTKIDSNIQYIVCNKNIFLKNPSDILIYEVHKFVHLTKLKQDRLTIVDLFGIVNMWCNTTNKRLYDNLPSNQQIYKMWNDLVLFTQIYKK